MPTGFPFSNLKYYTAKSQKINPQTVMKKIKPNPENQLFSEVNEKLYIKNSVKFDFQVWKNVDFNGVDYILLSDVEDILGLAFLISENKLNMERVQILGTLPALNLGKQMLIELKNLVNGRNRIVNESDLMKNYFEEQKMFQIFEEKYQVNIQQWVDIYDIEIIKKITESMISLNFGQIFPISEDKKIYIEPNSSGYMIGSCYWNFRLENDQFSIIHNLYLTQTTKIKEDTSYGKRHPLEFDLNKLNAFNPSSIFMTHNISISQESYEQQRTIYCKKIFEGLSTGQNVILPIRDSLILLDFADIFYYQIRNHARHIYVVSESASAIFKLSDGMIDYLIPNIANKVFLTGNPETPFHSFQKLVKDKFLTIIQDFSELEKISKKLSLNDHIAETTPSVFFVVDSSLRLGPTLQLIQLLSEITQKTQNFVGHLILSDPHITPDIADIIGGQYRVSFQQVHLDARLRANQIIQLFQQIRAQCIVLPQNTQQIVGLIGNRYKIYSNDKYVRVQYNEKQFNADNNKYVQLSQQEIEKNKVFDFQGMHILNLTLQKKQNQMILKDFNRQLNTHSKNVHFMRKNYSLQLKDLQNRLMSQLNLSYKRTISSPHKQEIYEFQTQQKEIYVIIYTENETKIFGENQQIIQGIIQCIQENLQIFSILKKF